MREISARRHDIGDVIHIEILDPALTDKDAVEHLASVLGTLVGKYPKIKLLLDFAHVAEIGSPLLAGLVEVHTKVAAAAGQLKLANLAEPIHEAFQLTKLDTVFDIYDSLHRAMNEFKTDSASRK